MDLSITSTIWAQLSIGCKMSCGARQPVAMAENELSFVVLRGASTRVFVKLEASDTYTVRLVKLNRKTCDVRDLERAEDVYADQLSEVVYGMVNK